MPCLGLSLSVGVSVCCEVFQGLKDIKKRVGTHQFFFRGMIRKRLRNTLENGVVYYIIHSNFGLFDLIKAHVGCDVRKKWYNPRFMFVIPTNIHLKSSWYQIWYSQDEAPCQLHPLQWRNTFSETEEGVSKNNGTPKSSILIGFSIIFTIHFGG